MPRPFDAPGMTPEVWSVAEECWCKEANEQPDVKEILQCFEEIANPGECTYRGCFESGS